MRSAGELARAEAAAEPARSQADDEVRIDLVPGHEHEAAVAAAVAGRHRLRAVPSTEA